jgi:Lrp/AsnC family leucine-responsive transcriptional regulator
MANNLDKTDLKILKRLQENGKITNLQLSSEVGLSPAPTLERVKKLEQGGFIKSYHAEVNELILGIGIQVWIQISLSRQRDNAISNFKKHIQTIDEIMECYQVTGDADYILKIMVQDIPAFEKLIAGRISKIEEIGQMKTMVILSQVKDSKVIPIPY